MTKRVLVTGANGQLGKAIQSFSNTFSELDIIFKKSSELDITNTQELKFFFEKEKLDWCINCAAYTAVDKAEEEKEKAYLVNVLGAKNLAEVCKEHSVKLIHISTDFVFNGMTNNPYSETDKTNPVSVYGQTKLEGEKEIQKILSEYFIIRTSWLYSEFGNNFMKSMLKLAKTRNELSIVNDQIGTPTYASDLAEVIIEFIKAKKTIYGIYHYSNDGQISWFDFAKEIFKLSRVNIHISPISSNQYQTLAKRPRYSVLNKSKIVETLSIQIPDWKYSLTKALNNL